MEDSKRANASFIFKKGKKEYPGSYRPVSFTYVLGKVMEKLFLETITKDVQEKRVIGSSQNGFVTGKLCLANPIAF